MGEDAYYGHLVLRLLAGLACSIRPVSSVRAA